MHAEPRAIVSTRRLVSIEVDEVEPLFQRAREAIARAEALCARVESSRKTADAVYKSTSGSRLRSGVRSASLIHDLENASYELQILQSRIDPVVKQDVVGLARAASQRR